MRRLVLALALALSVGTARAALTSPHDDFVDSDEEIQAAAPAPLTLDAAQEIAHRACEIAVYTLAAPEIPDDATDPRAEFVAEILCRWW